VSRRQRFWAWCLGIDALVLCTWPHKSISFYIVSGLVVAAIASILAEG
jgi:hypothetical protein